MDSELIAVLKGKYELPVDESHPPVQNKSFKIVNRLNIPLLVQSYLKGPKVEKGMQEEFGDEPSFWFLPGPGALIFDGVSKDVRGLKTISTVVGDYLICTCAATGSFVTAIKITKTSDTPHGDVDFTITQPKCSKNQIFEPPLPTADTLIPPDSPKFLVGTGRFVNPLDSKKVFTVLHEQFWKRSPSSFTIGPNGKKSVTVTTTHGRTETTSTNETINTALGINVSGGWGPFSASLSASLDYSKTVSQAVTLSDSVEVVLDDEYRNDSPTEERIYMYWVLMDQYNFVQVPDATTETSWAEGQRGVFHMPVTVECAQVPALLRIGSTTLDWK